MEDWVEEALLISFKIHFYFVFGCILNNPVFHHSNIPELRVGIVLIEIISCFLVILQGANLQILPFRLL